MDLMEKNARATSDRPDAIVASKGSQSRSLPVNILTRFLQIHR